MCGICLSEFGFSRSCDYLPFHLFSSRWHGFIANNIPHFLLHWSRCPGWLCRVAFVYSAAVDTVCRCLYRRRPFRYKSQCGIAASCGGSISAFWATSMCISTATTLIDIPTCNVEGSFPQPSPSFAICSLSSGHSEWNEIESWCGFFFFFVTFLPFTSDDVECLSLFISHLHSFWEPLFNSFAITSWSTWVLPRNPLPVPTSWGVFP